jgi:hypothetical protein
VEKGRVDALGVRLSPFAIEQIGDVGLFSGDMSVILPVWEAFRESRFAVAEWA